MLFLAAFAGASARQTTYYFCLQDDGQPGIAVLVNNQTGDYEYFCNNEYEAASGRGTLYTHGSFGSIDDTKGDRVVHVQWDFSANSGAGSGTAYIRRAGVTTCSITDKNLSNNSCPSP